MTGSGADLAVVTTDRHIGHDPEYELNAGRPVRPVPERPERIARLTEGLRGLWPDLRLLPPSVHDDTAVLAVHDAAMVRFLREGYLAWRDAGGPPTLIPDTFASPRWGGGGHRSASPLAEPGWWCFDTATPIVAGSWEATRSAVDVALTAAKLVAEGTSVAYALARPPGHHAGYDYFGGFCLLNPAAIAARELTAGGRVAIVDVDVHHGNGTQDLFWRDNAVLYASLHADPDHTFPYFSGFAEEVGEGPGRGTTINVPLAPGTVDATYLEAAGALLARVDAFAPATLVVSLGLDGADEDPIGPLALTADGYEALGRLIGERRLPTVLIQEGGYALDRLGALAAAFLRGLTAGHA